jgi:hypothetical protein
MISNFKKTFIPVFAVLLIAVVLFGLLSFAITMLESSVSPREVTTTNMVINRTRIFDYIREHGKLPEYLGQLSQTDGKGNLVKDGWGMPIIYLVSSNDTVTLESFGEYLHAGKINGSNDLVLSFQTKDDHGKWLNSASPTP